MKRCKSRSGFTLIEMIVVIAALTLVTGLIATTLLAVMRIEGAEVAFFNRILQQSALADQFRGDVATALEAPAKWGMLESGPGCLILRQPDGRHVVYLWEEESLVRTTHAGQTRTEQHLPLGTDPNFVEVTFSQPASRVYQLHLCGKPDTGKPRPRFDVRIAAALGGDLR